MSERNDLSIPFIVYEAEMDRQDRKHRRMFIVILILILSVVVSNMVWLYAWLQFDCTSYEAVSTDGGNASVVGNDGDITNGSGEIEETDQENP